MDLPLPRQSEVNKFVPKNAFFAKAALNTRLKDEFTSLIAKITWRYKLSESTISVPKTSGVEEIQIFQIELKEKRIPENALKVIDKLIPYPILYAFVYGESACYGITIKDNPNRKYYFSDWDERIDWNFHGPNLESVYEGIVKNFIRQPRSDAVEFETLVETDKKLDSLEKEIGTLRNKIRTEKQFNKKVELNKRLKERTEELEALKQSLLIPR